MLRFASTVLKNPMEGIFQRVPSARSSQGWAVFVLLLIAFTVTPMTYVKCSLPKVDTSGWITVTTGVFSLRVPPDFRRLKVQGYDSLVGKWEGKDAWFSYDFGRYSGPPSDSMDYRDFRICVTHIDNREVQIAVYRRRDRAYAVHAYWEDIGEGDERLSLYGEARNKENRKRLLAVVAQIQFLQGDE